MKIKIKRKVIVGGRHMLPESVVEVDEEAGKQLVRIGAGEEVNSKPAKRKTTKKQASDDVSE